MPLAVVTVSLSVLHFSHKTCMLQGGNQLQKKKFFSFLILHKEAL